MIITNKQYWTTANETSYVDGLASGAWRKWVDNPIEATAEQLLVNYIRGAENRKRWKTFGAVDADKVIKAAQNHLDRVKG
jgi:hypothetical protein